MDEQIYKDAVLPRFKKDLRLSLLDATARAAEDVKKVGNFDFFLMYGMNSGLTDAQTVAQLAAVRKIWRQLSRLKSLESTIKTLQKLDDLLGESLNHASTWQQFAAVQEAAGSKVIKQLSGALERSYGSIGAITSELLATTATSMPDFATLTDADRFNAVKQAHLTLVKHVDLATSPPQGFSVVSMNGLLDTVGVDTFVDVVFASRTAPFGVLGSTGFMFSSGVVNAAAIEKANKRLDSAARSTVVGAQKNVLSSLSTALEKGVNLAEVLCFQLAEAARPMVAASLHLEAVNELCSRGLRKDDAQRIVLSCQGSNVAPAASVDDVLSLLRSGRASAALSLATQLPHSGEGTETSRRKVSDALQDLNRLRLRAAEQIHSGQIDGARTSLTAALAIDQDDEQVAADLANLPPSTPSPPRLVALWKDNRVEIRISWNAGIDSGETTRYRIIRKEGTAPVDIADGVVIATSCADLSCSDRAPLLARPIYYAVFATNDSRSFSTGASATLTAVPEVCGVSKDVDTDSFTMSWTTASQAVDVQVVVVGPNGTRVPAQRGDKSSLTVQAVEQGSEYRVELVAVYRDARGRSINSSPTVVLVTPRGRAMPVTTLDVTATLIGNEHRAIARWAHQPSHEVQIWFGTTKPTVRMGSIIPLSSLSKFGAQLRGAVQVRGAEATLKARIGGGRNYFVPFTLSDQGAVAGRVVELAICPPISNTEAERFGTELRIAWDWPGDEYEVTATWSGPNTSGSSMITREQYRLAGGLRLQVGNGPVNVKLATRLANAEANWESPLVVLDSPGAQSQLAYQIIWKRPLAAIFGGGRAVDIQLQSTGLSGGAILAVVVKPGRIPPRTADAGQLLEEITVNLAENEVMTHTIPLPKIAKPYRLRCFLLTGDGISLIDPPLSTLEGH